LFLAGVQIYNSAYNELTTPTNLVTPLAVRVVVGVFPAVLLLVLTWFVSEVLGAMTVRRVVLLNTGILRSFAGALFQLVRRPISTGATTIVSYAVSAVAIGLALAASAVAFDWCRVAARNPDPITITVGIVPFATTRDFRPVVFLLAAAVLCLAWIAALAISGVCSAWRSAALTGETLAAEPNVDLDAAIGRCGLLGASSERSGD
jgi:predicted small integral membrane protein